MLLNATRRRRHARRAAAAAAVLAGIMLLQAPGTAQAGGFDRLLLIVEERTIPLNEAAQAARRVGEACIFGATAGAVGALMAGAPIAANGIAAPSVVSIAIGAAAVGCLVGFAGSSAASGFGFFWDRSVQPKLERVPSGGGFAVSVGGEQASRAGLLP